MPPVSPANSFLFVPRSAKADEPISDIFVSSLELDVREPSKLVRRDESGLSPLAQHELQTRTLAPRADGFVHGQGTKDPSTFNNKGFFALFALLGAAMVIASIWFFFWAKNGGFHFREGDWDDYKSTVLRRKGPDGKTLSNATKSTKLGGGTIAGTQRYNWARSQAQSVVGRDEKGRKGILATRGWGKTHSVTYKDDFTDYTTSYGDRTVTDEMTELRTDADTEYHGGHHSKRYRDRDVKQYRKEKPARVGGMNRVADSTNYDSSVPGGSDVMTETVLTESSEQNLLPKSNREKEAERAERRARAEAAKMERRWKREAEEAAAALARESSRPPPPPAHVRKSSSPSKHPTSHKHHRARSSSRSASPRKRDFSYGVGPESETLSTAYTQSTSQGTRTASYYDEYRPRASENPRYSSEYRSTRQSSQSPRKKDRAGRGGYRRGGQDSDLE